MGRKRIKQYLTLLLAIGVIAVIATGGGGTFASFNAEVTNGGNTFATGSLILNNTHGTRTCTSALNTGSNQAATSNLNSTGQNCSVLFTVHPFQYVHAAVAAGASTDTTLTLSTVTGTIYRGDTLTITPSSGSAFTVTAANTSPFTTASGTLAISGTLGHTFSSATLIDSSPTSLADVTLQNAGTLNASDITVTPAGCTNGYGEGHGTLTSNVTAGQAVTSIPYTSVAGTFKDGDPIVVSDGTNTQTFIANGDWTSGNISVRSGQSWNFAYQAANTTVSGPQFHGTTANTLCNSLLLSITEESDGTYPASFGTASSCVYGGNTSPLATNACDLTQGIGLNSTSATALGTDTLTAGQSRYYQLAVHLNSSGFDNTYQDTAATNFSLTWHIDQ